MESFLNKSKTMDVNNKILFYNPSLFLPLSLSLSLSLFIQNLNTKLIIYYHIYKKIY